MSKSLLPLLSFVNTGKQKKESCFSDFFIQTLGESVVGWNGLLWRGKWLEKKKEKNPDKMEKWILLGWDGVKVIEYFVLSLSYSY